MINHEFKVGKATVRLLKGDITEMETDAIVNAANSSLMGGGGVDGAINRKGGPKILEECKKIRAIEWPEGLPTGKAVITSAGNLKAKYAIHTVGPVWRGGNRSEPELLAQAYRNSLRLAVSKGLKTSLSFHKYGRVRLPCRRREPYSIESCKGVPGKRGQARRSDFRLVF